MIVTVEEFARPPRVKIQTTAETVARVAADGTSAPVRGDVVGGVIYDYECPQQQPVTYDDGLTVSTPVALPDCGNWLVHLIDPTLSVPLEIESEADIETPSRVSTLAVESGAPYTVAVGHRDAKSTAMTVHGLDADEVKALHAILWDQSILFLSVHDGHDELGPRYVRILDVVSSRFYPSGHNPWRVLSLPYIVQDRPVVIDAARTGWDLMPTTWAAMPTTWAGMPS